MSEELNKDQEVTEKYQYVSDDGEKLIVDKPSEPLKKVKKIVKSEIIESITTEPVETTTVATTVAPLVVPIVSKTYRRENRFENVSKSNKEMYESYIKELKNFCLSINGEIVYDSSIDKFKDIPVKFENDYFILYGKKYSYNGLKIQKINSK